ncbi:unnamed protein product [Spirodela intermedia]|uniref:Uncharacterized protein n=1 Tax=Spirodela intermedia TaxID=51605 RepID=A0A7I8K5Q4_SPIIN|nr:unnamed protein product [Spirodela intermedia]
MRVLRSDVGAGRSLLALLRLAVVESLLPSCTVHEGPPSCHSRRKYKIPNQSCVLGEETRWCCG